MTAPPAAGFDLCACIRDLIATGEPDAYRRVHADVDRVVFQEVLQHTGGHLRKTSRLLHISETTLGDKLRNLGLAVEKQLRPAACAGGRALRIV